jgi:uncharacterized protein (TIGR02145 family)
MRIIKSNPKETNQVTHPLRGSLYIIMIFVFLVLFHACKKEEPLSLITEPAYSITYHSVVCGLKWLGDSYNYVEGGVCYSETHNPSYTDQKIRIDNPTIESVSNLQINNLLPDNKYYIRSYLISFTGTAEKINYGNEVEFTTLSFDETIHFNEVLTYDTISDIDGNIYKTIMIGNQIWMAENLQTTRLYDGTSITPVNFSELELNYMNTNPAYGWYDNYPEYCKPTFGKLYNWFAVNTGKLCPAGWNVASVYDWETLISYLGGRDIAGDKLKETGIAHWDPPNAESTNESGFTALPSLAPGVSEGWWSRTQLGTEEYANVWSYWVGGNYSKVERGDVRTNTGLHVRCIKDKH